MDLSTIEQKLDDSKYTTLNDVSTCYHYTINKMHEKITQFWLVKMSAVFK